ncbi:MAG: hypothetical protein AVDCRST_MAG75-2339 [uncultured Propionibacteriaceae bacterium]|uniref:Uncharacterized protein n=1 Tax=uncultured Propionibacteriaceae bacterium TaxID=257457 RepID=A0A6J4P5S6_9ACTN|nr:MAG: hypothetical protein AVDCRST_MAG75-2339 [uncultured Propionibacteriaceae bacterium]
MRANSLIERLSAPLSRSSTVRGVYEGRSWRRLGSVGRLDPDQEAVAGSSSGT